jgi:hypothetical protein
MSGRGKRIALGVLVALLLVAGCVWFLRSPRPAQLTPEDRATLRAHTVLIAGETYGILRGVAYRQSPGSDEWTFVDHLFDPNYKEINYQTHNGVLCRKSLEDGKLYPVLHSFKEDFEGTASVRNLIGPTRGWTQFTLQSPQAQTIPEYVALRHGILAGRESFRDNRIEPATETVHGGSVALKCHSVAPSRGMVCAKASIETELLHFTKGDDVWFSGWFFVQDGHPLTLMDLESTWIAQGPGPRLILENGCVAVELKWADKPMYRQPEGRRVPMPKGQWVHLEVHYKLSEMEDGTIEVWQDRQPIIAATGRNLPLADAILNRMEIGITATKEDATLFVDDLEVGEKRVGESP